MKPSTVSQLSLSESALKLAYGNVEFQNFPREDHGPPAPTGGKGREGGVEERRGGGGEGMGKSEGKGWKERGEKGRGEGSGICTPPRSSKQIDATGPMI
jgi:hypothetical protein